MLSCLSRVQLVATLWTVAHQAPQPMGFYRKESWSMLPCLAMSGSLTQRSNLCLLHSRQIAYHWATREAPNQYQTKYLKGHYDNRIIPTTPPHHQRHSNPNPWKLHTRWNVTPGHRTLHSKRNLAAVIQLRALQWKVTQDYLSRPDVVTAGRPKSQYQWCGLRKTQPVNPGF